MVQDAGNLIEELAVPYRASHAFWRLMQVGPAALPQVTRALRHESADVRLYCCRLLDHFFVPESLGEMLGMLDDPDPRVRGATLHTLACDRCKADACAPDPLEVLPRAISILAGDPDRHVRAMAVEVVEVGSHLARGGTRPAGGAPRRPPPLGAQEGRLVRPRRPDPPANRAEDQGEVGLVL
ncbi:MAG: HEAT repeat domain-containing protein [Caulobacterales bacterium]